MSHLKPWQNKKGQTFFGMHCFLIIFVYNLNKLHAAKNFKTVHSYFDRTLEIPNYGKIV